MNYHKTLWLPHIDLLMNINMQEVTLHMYLITWPSLWSCKWKCKINRIHLGNKRNILKIINSLNLWKPQVVRRWSLYLSIKPYPTYLVRYTHLQQTNFLPLWEQTRSQVWFLINEEYSSTIALSHSRIPITSKKFWGSSKMAWIKRETPNVYEWVQHEFEGSLGQSPIASIIPRDHLRSGARGGQGWTGITSSSSK